MNFKNKFLFIAMFVMTVINANASEGKKDLYCVGYVDGHNSHTLEVSLTSETDGTYLLNALINRGTHQEKNCGPFVLTPSGRDPLLFDFTCKTDPVKLYYSLSEDRWYGVRKILVIGTSYYPLDFDCK